jgi:hypothetical protein
MATTASEALNALGIEEWVLRGEPTTEDHFKEMFRKITGSDSDGSAIETSDTSKWGVTWKQVSDKMKAMDDAAPMNELRKQRNAKLAETDWMGNSDVTMSAAWKTYRKNLRDLPDGASPTLTDGVLGNVTWPTKPS